MKFAAAVIAVAALAASQVAAQISVFQSEVVGQYAANGIPADVDPFVGYKSLVLNNDNTYSAELTQLCNQKCGLISDQFLIYQEKGTFNITLIDDEGAIVNAVVDFVPSSTGANSTVDAPYTLGLSLASDFDNQLTLTGYFPHNQAGFLQFQQQNVSTICNGFGSVHCQGGRCGGNLEPAFSCAPDLVCRTSNPDAAGVCAQPVGQFAFCNSAINPPVVCDSGLTCAFNILCL